MLQSKGGEEWRRGGGERGMGWGGKWSECVKRPAIGGTGFEGPELATTTPPKTP